MLKEEIVKFLMEYGYIVIFIFIPIVVLMFIHEINKLVAIILIAFKKNMSSMRAEAISKIASPTTIIFKQKE